MKVSKSIVTTFLLVILYKIVLELIYVRFVAEVYSYMGFLIDFSIIKLIESYILLALVYIFLPINGEKISNIAIQILFLLALIPILSLYALADRPRPFVYFSIIGFCLTVLTVKIFPGIVFRKVRLAKGPFFLAIGLFSLAVYVFLFKLNGIPSLKAFSFDLVYEIRQEVQYGFLFGYFSKWQGRVINCFLIGIALYHRKYIAVILLMGLQVILFLTVAQKSYLINPLLVIFFFYAIKKRKVMQITLAALTSVLVFSLMLIENGLWRLPASMLARRTMFVPAQISFYYYDYFSQHEKMYLSNSKVTLGLIDNPYEDKFESNANMIGLFYLGDENIHANTGYLADAYMNFGLLGVLAFSVLLGIILVLVDSLSNGLDRRVAMAAVIGPVVSLVNGALLTVMFTGGFLVGLLIIRVYREKDQTWVS